MNWSHSAIVLTLAPFHENEAIVTLLTAELGKVRGLVYGAQSARQRQVWQIGNRVQANFRARLEEQLGILSGELDDGGNDGSRDDYGAAALAMQVLDDPLRLGAIAAATALAAASLPDQVPQPHVYAGLNSLLRLIPSEFFLFALVRWELELLAALGFGLDLGSCAATGTVSDLAFVSPKSGRAVCLSAAEPYKEKLLRLPAFLLPRAAAAFPDEEADLAAAYDGLKLTGYFLEHRLFAAHHQGLPTARLILTQRIMARLV